MAKRKRATLLGTIAASCVLAAGSAAWACSANSGVNTTLSPTSGLPGSTVSTGTSGNNLPADTYYFRFQDGLSTTECHHQSAIGAGVTLSVAGTISAVNRTIPSDASEGFDASVCWANNGHTDGSIAATFSVT